MLLAGDIGGSRTRLAIISPQIGPRAPLSEATFPSRQYPGLEDVVGEFLGQAAVEVDRASFGVAGPVVDGRVVTTNLPWVVDATRLSQKLAIPSVHLLNDLEAVAFAVPRLSEASADLYTLNAGQAVPGGAIGVIAPGTGLGEAYLTFDGDRYQAHASEGGHTDFAPATRDEIALLQYLFDHLDHVSYERICSGIGIPNIYDFLRDSGYATEPQWLAEELAIANDRTPTIVRTALDPEKDCKLCTATLDMFVSILGSEAGNLALKMLATGGIYLGGGIPPRILPALKGDRFLAAFRNKGRMATWLADVPIQVILNPKAALLGAAYFGLKN